MSIFLDRDRIRLRTDQRATTRAPSTSTPIREGTRCHSRREELQTGTSPEGPRSAPSRCFHPEPHLPPTKTLFRHYHVNGIKKEIKAHDKCVAH